MRHDAAAGGNVPALDGAALLALAPGLAELATFTVEDWARLPAVHVGADRLWALRERVRAIAESGACDAILVTHGTDTLEETAALLARTVAGDLPIVVTGAMRTSSDPDWDGPRNLLDAARVATDPGARGRGALVVFAGRILPGLLAVKTEATAVPAFEAPHGAPAGDVADGVVRWFAAPAPRRVVAPRDLSARVAIVPLLPGDDGFLLEAALPRFDGVVIVSYGSGNTPPGAIPAVRCWLGAGKPVVLATRCARGAVTPVYAFEGGSARMVELGCIPAGPRTPWQARLELQIALGAGVPYGA